MARRLPLPRGWKRRVKSSVDHVLALSHCTFTALVARAANEVAGPTGIWETFEFQGVIICGSNQLSGGG